VNYRELLKKYMDHVLAEEGVTFCEPGMAGRWQAMSSEEQAELRRIEAELWEKS
jgi:hypothetical protein